MQVLVQQGRLKVTARSMEAERLRREMLGLKLAGRGTEGVHDDLAVAVALALWKARAGAVIRGRGALDWLLDTISQSRKVAKVRKESRKGARLTRARWPVRFGRHTK